MISLCKNFIHLTTKIEKKINRTYLRTTVCYIPYISPPETEIPSRCDPNNIQFTPV